MSAVYPVSQRDGRRNQLIRYVSHLMIGQPSDEAKVVNTGKEPTLAATTQSAASAELLGRLKEAYDGEVIGVRLFGELAESAADPYRREVYLAHQDVERVTRDILKPVLRTHRLPVSDEPDGRYAGFMQFFTDRSWRESWESLAPQLESAVVKFKAIRDELDPSHEALIALVEHEEALLSFSRQEIAGHDGLKGLRSYVAKYGKTM